MQERLTHPKGKALCRICCWKGWYALLIWCRNHGMNTLPISLQTKKLLLNEVGVQWTTTSSSIRKFNWKTPNLQTEANNNQPVSSIPPSGLNLSQGITGTLVDQVIQYRNREDARNGINLDKLACQRKETLLMAIASNKRYKSGLHVAAGRYLLGPEVVDDQLKRKSHAK